MRDWTEYWRDCQPLVSNATEDALRQVGKTEGGVPVPNENLDLIVSTIADSLGLTLDDHIADLGCGNGILTQRLSAMCASVHAVDKSVSLIRSARAHFAAPNCRYDVGSIETFPSTLDKGVSKILAYEVLQHLSFDQVCNMIDHMVERPIERLSFFAGSIPDVEKLRAFYDTDERWQAYQDSVASQRSHLGRWWSKDEFVEIGRRFDLTCAIRPQHAALYTARYRFDVLFHSDL